MRTISLTFSMAAVWIGLTTQASAGWNFTEWGMSPEQVILSSKGSVAPVLPSDTGFSQGIRAEGMIASGDLKLKARFGFGPHGLDAVILVPQPGDCPAFVQALHGKYFAEMSSAKMGGVPIQPKMIWDVPTINSRISLTSLFSGGCDAEYTALKTANADGL